ncbi:MAG: response regulator [Chloroflexi bacterium]|nr:response regulator [Chloroflexota bacterium]
MTKKVLILDDNADNRELLGFALMTGDYEIHKAELGKDAMQMVESTQFDLALLDVELPDIDGLDLAETMRTRYPDVGLIMLSANDNMDRLEKARRVGANAYVIKPFNLPELLKFLKKFEADVPRPPEMLVL